VSVFGTFRIDTRPYTGYTDPGLPIGSWIAQAGLVGDASGGILRMNFLIEREGGVRVSELYNIEQFSADTSSSTGRDITLATINMDRLAPTRQASPQKWRMATIVGGDGTSAIDTAKLMGLPYWLGAPDVDTPAGDKGFSVTFLNIDLLLFAATVQGYFWGPRSVTAPGGPRRPVAGFLGK